MPQPLSGNSPSVAPLGSGSFGITNPLAGRGAASIGRAAGAAGDSVLGIARRKSVRDARESALTERLTREQKAVDEKSKKRALSQASTSAIASLKIDLRDLSATPGRLEEEYGNDFIAAATKAWDEVKTNPRVASFLSKYGEEEFSDVSTQAESIIYEWITEQVNSLEAVITVEGAREATEIQLEMADKLDPTSPSYTIGVGDIVNDFNGLIEAEPNEKIREYYQKNKILAVNNLILKASSKEQAMGLVKHLPAGIREKVRREIARDWVVKDKSASFLIKNTAEQGLSNLAENGEMNNNQLAAIEAAKQIEGADKWNAKVDAAIVEYEIPKDVYNLFNTNGIDGLKDAVNKAYSPGNGQLWKGNTATVEGRERIRNLALKEVELYDKLIGEGRAHEIELGQPEIASEIFRAEVAEAEGNPEEADNIRKGVQDQIHANLASKGLPDYLINPVFHFDNLITAVNEGNSTGVEILEAFQNFSGVSGGYGPDAISNFIRRGDSKSRGLRGWVLPVSYAIGKNGMLDQALPYLSEFIEAQFPRNVEAYGKVQPQFRSIVDSAIRDEGGSLNTIVEAITRGKGLDFAIAADVRTAISNYVAFQSFGSQSKPVNLAVMDATSAMEHLVLVTHSTSGKPIAIESSKFTKRSMFDKIVPGGVSDYSDASKTVANLIQAKEDFGNAPLFFKAYKDLSLPAKMLMSSPLSWVPFNLYTTLTDRRSDIFGDVGIDPIDYGELDIAQFPGALDSLTSEQRESIGDLNEAEINYLIFKERGDWIYRNGDLIPVLYGGEFGGDPSTSIGSTMKDSTNFKLVKKKDGTPFTLSIDDLLADNAKWEKARRKFLVKSISAVALGPLTVPSALKN